MVKATLDTANLDIPAALLWLSIDDLVCLHAQLVLVIQAPDHQCLACRLRGGVSTGHHLQS